MSEEEKTNREMVLEAEGLQYQWYVGYDRSMEYEKNPEWATDMRYEEKDGEDVPEYEREVKIYDKFDPEHIWIKSTKKYSLMAMR